MTSKEIAMQNIENELEQKKRQLNELQSEITFLENELEDYKNIPDSYFDTILESCDDFPLKSHWCYRISKEIGTFYVDSYKYATINDLIHSSPESLLKVSGIGKEKLKMIEQWMEKHNLSFIS